MQAWGIYSPFTNFTGNSLVYGVEADITKGLLPVDKEEQNQTSTCIRYVYIEVDAITVLFRS